MTNKTLINNKKEVSKREMIITFLLGATVGIILFICLYGIKILNFTYVDWLYQHGDLMQHQIGWEAYRNSKWYFPVGLTDKLVFPNKIPVIYTDSIPLFAVIFKCLSGLLPANFQYIGFFGLTCFALQGGFSVLLIRKFIDNKLVCLVGSILFIYNSVLIYRMFAHTALAAQWLILAAWCLVVYKNNINSNKQVILLWSILLSLTPCIHMYYVPMIGIILMFFAIYCFKESKDWKTSLAIFGIPCLCCLSIMFVLGAFYGGVVNGTNDILIYTMNINSFINPIPIDHSGRVSLLLKPLPVDFGQYEGGCYLGLGVIAFLIVIIFVNLIIRLKNKNQNKNKKNHIPYQYAHPLRFYLMLMVLVFYILSLGTTVKLGTIPITNIWYPQFVLKILSIFRSTGRFIWPVYYLIFLYVIVKLREIFQDNKKFTLVVCLTVVVNLIDYSGMLIDYHNYYKQEFQRQTHLLNEQWENIENKNIILLFASQGNEIFDFGETLIKRGNSLNIFYLARAPYNKIEERSNQILNDLKNKSLEKDAICIFRESDDISWIPKDAYELLNLDGYTLIYNKN